jgi:hypothetical protein
MPFDYMWQFLTIPFQIKSFIMEVLVLINQKRFDFEAEISKYYKSSEQLIGSSARIKKKWSCKYDDIESAYL